MIQIADCKFRPVAFTYKDKPRLAVITRYDNGLAHCVQVEPEMGPRSFKVAQMMGVEDVDPAGFMEAHPEVLPILEQEAGRG